MLRLLFRPPEEEQLGEIEGRRKEETACACAVSPIKTVCLCHAAYAGADDP